MIIYVASPLRGNNKKEISDNIEFAKNCCRSIMNEGDIPFAPHLYFTQFMDDNNEQDRKIAMQMGLNILIHCDKIYVCGNRISEGMQHEINIAKENNIPIELRFRGEDNE